MKTTSLYAWCLIAYLMAMPAIGQEEAANQPKPEPQPQPGEIQPAQPDKPKPKEKATKDPGTLRFHLMDGTVITGKLQTQTLPIKTAFGDLVVPLSSIRNLKPGLDTHAKLDQRIQGLIQDLSAPEAERRDEAQQELTSFGPELIPELERHSSSDDAERKVRIGNIIEALYSAEDSFEEDAGPTVSLHRLDTIETEHFTIAGQIQLEKFTVKSKFGELAVNLSDIKAAEELTEDSPEIRKAVEVSGVNMTPNRYKNTAIKVKRGDKIIIHAEGRITMTPWGNNSVSSPDGIPQNGMYNANIPMGALAGRIGDDGPEFLVGSKKTFTAEKSGTLHLGFAMQANWANYQFPGSYKTRIRVVPAD